jgi:hypothetical protein
VPEVALSIVRRILREEPILAADRERIQHGIPDRGLAPRRVALVLCGMVRPFDSGEVCLL